MTNNGTNARSLDSFLMQFLDEIGICEEPSFSTNQYRFLVDRLRSLRDQILHPHDVEREIAVIWGIEDVQFVRPDLSDEQAWEVLKHVRDRLDANDGVSWEMLEQAAEHMFGAEVDA